jgi:hypothetical protein
MIETLEKAEFNLNDFSTYYMVDDLDLKHPDLFEKSDNEKTSIFCLQYKASPMKFFVITKEDHFERYLYIFTKFAPGFEQIEESKKYYSINGLMSPFKKWLHMHLNPFIHEETTSDPWKEIQNDFMWGTGQKEEDEFKTFTNEEQKLLTNALAEIKEKIIEETDPNEDEKKFIEERFEYISNSLDKLTRFDFKALLFYTIHNIVLHLTLNPEQSRSLLELVKAGFSQIRFLLIG